MGRRKKVKDNDPFVREEFFITDDGKTVNKGDLIKIRGIWGVKFKFLNYVTNPKNNVSWIDCLQLERGISCAFRSFYPDRVKLIPKKRGKRVKRSSQTP